MWYNQQYKVLKSNALILRTIFERIQTYEEQNEMKRLLFKNIWDWDRGM